MLESAWIGQLVYPAGLTPPLFKQMTRMPGKLFSLY